MNSKIKKYRVWAENMNGTERVAIELAAKMQDGNLVVTKAEMMRIAMTACYWGLNECDSDYKFGQGSIYCEIGGGVSVPVKISCTMSKQKTISCRNFNRLVDCVSWNIGRDAEFEDCKK